MSKDDEESKARHLSKLSKVEVLEGRRSTDNGQRTTDNGEQATGNGQRATGNGQQAAARRVFTGAGSGRLRPSNLRCEIAAGDGQKAPSTPSSCFDTSHKSWQWLPVECEITAYTSAFSLAGAIRSSTNVFHSWQCGHCQSSSVLR